MPLIGRNVWRFVMTIVLYAVTHELTQTEHEHDVIL